MEAKEKPQPWQYWATIFHKMYKDDVSLYRLILKG